MKINTKVNWLASSWCSSIFQFAWICSSCSLHFKLALVGYYKRTCVLAWATLTMLYPDCLPFTMGIKTMHWKSAETDRLLHQGQTRMNEAQRGSPGTVFIHSSQSQHRHWKPNILFIVPNWMKNIGTCLRNQKSMICGQKMVYSWDYSHNL